MILQALNSYYWRKFDDPDPAQRLPAFGLEQKEIPFILEITTAGEVVQLRDTRTHQGKKKVAQSFRVPQGVKKTSGVAANLLWDTLEYVLGVDTKGKPVRVAEQHAAFVQRIAQLSPAAQADVGIQAVRNFLERDDWELQFTQLQSLPSWAELLETNPVLSFRLHGDLDLICQRPAVVQAALNAPAAADERQAMCLVTGEFAPVERLHTAIKGVWGAQTSGANIVSFNARAFESYGKTERQGENAPVCQSAAFAYTTALNHLLRKDSPQRIQVGDASTVFWADRDSEFEAIGADVFGEPSKDDPDRGTRAVHALLSAVQSGKFAEPDDNRFHILGLAPNAARVSIRFYHCLPLPEMAGRIAQHFRDLELVPGPNDPQYPSLKRLLQAICMATSSQPYGDIDKAPPNLGGAIVDAIFAGPDVPYPALWLNTAVGRCRAEQAKKTQQGKSAPNVPYARAAVIKACLNRQIRRAALSAPSSTSSEKEFLPMLDLDNTNPAYRLGRLFAVLEKIQEETSDGKLNSTIRDRYYGAASSSPASVFPTLIKLTGHHIGKLSDKGNAMLYRAFQDHAPDSYIGIVLNGVADFPAHLSLPDQGRFSLGYYHQRQAFFSKPIDSNTPAKEGTSE
jgi:CRISPR-associated protein Csd1